MKTMLLCIMAAALGIVLGSMRVAAQESTLKSETTTTKTESNETSGESASQKAETEKEGVTAELLSVSRTDGDSLTIKFKYSNGSQKELKLGELSEYGHDNVAEKVYYIDGKNKKKYSVIKDTEGKFIASNMKSTLAAGESKSGWSKLPAPPADVTAVTVYLPGTPPFEGVKISK